MPLLPLTADFDDVARDICRRAKLRTAMWRWWDAAQAGRRRAPPRHSPTYSQW